MDSLSRYIKLNGGAKKRVKVPWNSYGAVAVEWWRTCSWSPLG